MSRDETALIDLHLIEGSTGFGILWRRFSLQFTQSQLIRLCETYLGTKAVHSSQIMGLATRKLREPGPRLFLALGYVNTALARTTGYAEELIEPTTDIGYPHQLPIALRDLWEGREPMCDASGVALGPTGLFEAFTGLRALGFEERPRITDATAAEASAALGRHLRLNLAKRGIDWLEDIQTLERQSPLLVRLVQRETLSAQEVEEAMPSIAYLLKEPEEGLWDVAAHLRR